MKTPSKLLCVSLVLFAGAAQSAIITQNGNTVSFTYDDAGLGLFGTPTVSGDSFFFTPTNFKAQSINTGSLGFGNTASTTAVTIKALQNTSSIDSISLTERGDYNQMNVVDNTMSHAKVGVGGQIRALDVATQDEVTSQISHAAFATTADDFTTTNWTGTASVDTTSLSSKAITLTIQNLLFAVSPTVGDYAFVEKKFAGLKVSTSAVPLPAAVWLFGAALFGFLSVSKKNRQL
jgi:hypothetical protein